MAIELYQLLDQQGMTTLATQLLTKTNVRIQERIVTIIDENATSKQVASAKALYTMLQAIQTNNDGIAEYLDEHDVQLENQATSIGDLETTQDAQDGKLTDVESGLANLTTKIGDLVHLTIETVTGDISTVADPRDDVLYFQRDNEADTMWMLYIYQPSAVEGEDGTWVNIGDTEVDLSGIWSKDETEELKEALGIHNVETLSDETLVTVADAAYEANAVELRATPTGEPTVASEVEVGTALSDVPISGTMMYGNVEVPGTFSWVTTDEEFDAMVNA